MIVFFCTKMGSTCILKFANMSSLQINATFFSAYIPIKRNIVILAISIILYAEQNGHLQCTYITDSQFFDSIF